MPKSSAGQTPTGTMGWVALGLSAALLAYSGTVHLIPGFNALYVPLSLLATAGLAAVAWRVGLGLADLGLLRTNVSTGLAWGLAIAAITAGLLTVAVAVPAVRPLFGDARIAGIGSDLLVYRALIRIPLGTALFEEFAFRGVLLGAWSRVTSAPRAVAASSATFGLWHIRPTIELLEANALATSTLSRVFAVAAAALLTLGAGYLFCLLRIRTESLFAPFVAHAAVNSLAIIAAFAVAEAG